MPESDKRPLKVFLSYASQDKPVVREFSARLASEGWVDPWVDEKKLLPGHDWRTKIEEAVETSDVVIICLSSSSVGKEGFVQKELRYAREIAFEKPDEAIFLIPLRLDDCLVPRGLRFYQWGDYFGEKRDDTYIALLEALKIRHEQKLKLEETEHARLEEERLEREAIQRAAREKTERENVERIAREEAERETAEKAKRGKAEREKAEKVAREKAKLDAKEKVKHEKTERQAVLKETFSKAFIRYKSAPLLRILGFAGIAVVLFWVGSWGIPKFDSIFPTANISLTPTLHASATGTFTITPSLATGTATRLISPTPTRILSPTPSYLSPLEYNLNFEQADYGWVISRSNIYYIGGPSLEWASDGTWSYRLTHFKVNDPSCSNYAYPGDFVQITRRVDLSYVTGIVLDLKCITCSHWDGNVKGMHVEVRIDKKPIGTVYSIPNELLNYKFPIVDMSGSHLLSIRLGVDRELCYGVESGFYVDNIRFITNPLETKTATP